MATPCSTATAQSRDSGKATTNVVVAVVVVAAVGMVAVVTDMALARMSPLAVAVPTAPCPICVTDGGSGVTF